MNLLRAPRALALLAIVATTMALAMPVAAQEGDVARVTVIHAIPGEGGFPADVYLNGDLAIDGFLFETKTDVLELPAGEAALDIYPDGGDPETDDPAVSETVTFAAGTDYSLVASLVDGKPVLSVYENDTSPLEAGQARLTIRQTSLNPTLDVLLDGEEVVAGLEAPAAASVDRPAGSYSLSFVASDGQVDQDVDLSAGQVNIFYAVGGFEDDSFSILNQTVSAQMEDPTGVATGTAGLKDAGFGGLSWSMITAGAALVSMLTMVTRRRWASN